jgi:protein-L-isoaspartate(D-aspartate) O-methyltransferase
MNSSGLGGMKMNPHLNFFFVGIIAFACVCRELPKKAEDMAHQSAEDRYTELRHQMVDWQIVKRGVKNKQVLDAMRRVERHKFVPKQTQRYAYHDEPLPIGHGQTISQPYIVAYMTEALDLKQNDKVLEIGTGSGYQAAILAEIVRDVFTIEIVQPLAVTAREILSDQKYSNIHCRTGDGYMGWPEEAPFDGIMITAAPPEIPEPLMNQLKEGGRMIVPVGTSFQQLILITNKNGKLVRQSLLPVRFVPMTGEIQKIKKN